MPATSTVTCPQEVSFSSPMFQTLHLVISQEPLDLSRQPCLLGDIPVLLTEVDSDAKTQMQNEFRFSYRGCLDSKLAGTRKWCTAFQHSRALLKRLININPADKAEMLTVSNSRTQKGTLGYVESKLVNVESIPLASVCTCPNLQTIKGVFPHVDELLTLSIKWRDEESK